MDGLRQRLETVLEGTFFKELTLLIDQLLSVDYC
jgi:hypothetical protein